MENNPVIQASQNNANAKRSLILPSQTLPDPMFKFQNMGDLWPPTLQEGDPSSARTYGFEQDIPFPGKLGLKGKMAEMEAEAEKWNTEQTRHHVIAELKSGFYDLYLIHKTLATVEKNKDLLQQFTRIAEEKYRVGQGIQQDVLKAHVEISKLIDRQMVQEQRRGSTEAQTNSLLYRPPGTPLGRPAEVKKAGAAIFHGAASRHGGSQFPGTRSSRFSWRRSALPARSWPCHLSSCCPFRTSSSRSPSTGRRGPARSSPWPASPCCS